jgi:hypothetical protein
MIGLRHGAVKMDCRREGSVPAKNQIFLHQTGIRGMFRTDALRDNFWKLPIAAVSVRVAKRRAARNAGFCKDFARVFQGLCRIFPADAKRFCATSS